MIESLYEECRKVSLKVNQEKAKDNEKQTIYTYNFPISRSFIEDPDLVEGLKSKAKVAAKRVPITFEMEIVLTRSERTRR